MDRWIDGLTEAHLVGNDAKLKMPFYICSTGAQIARTTFAPSLQKSVRPLEFCNEFTDTSFTEADIQDVNISQIASAIDTKAQEGASLPFTDTHTPSSQPQL